MRTKQDYKRITVTAQTHKRLMADRDHFQKVIGDGIWSVNDTIMEYHKILNQLEDAGLLRSGLKREKR